LFSGGSACRNINIALSRRGVDLTRIVPAWDSGAVPRSFARPSTCFRWATFARL
jgi:hypothetical protein